MRPFDRRSALASLAGALALPAAPSLAASDAFATWLAALRREASKKGIDAAVLDAAFAGVRPIACGDRGRPAPARRPDDFAEYRRRVVSDDRIERGRELLARHAPLLRQVEARYGVPPEVMVALWGIESNFGERQGGYSVFAALATLAYEGRRAAFFRRELLSALQIADQGLRRCGRDAGLLGRRHGPEPVHAVHLSGLRRGLRRRRPSRHLELAARRVRVDGQLSRPLGLGRAAIIWGREVARRPASPQSRTGLEHRAPLATWEQRGVRLPDGDRLPSVDINASLLRMDGGAGPSYLAYGNFRALMAWNRSTYFGVSVGLLSDSLKDGWRS